MPSSSPPARGRCKANKQEYHPIINFLFVLEKLFILQRLNFINSRWLIFACLSIFCHLYDNFLAADYWQWMKFVANSQHSWWYFIQKWAQDRDRVTPNDFHGVLHSSNFVFKRKNVSIILSSIHRCLETRWLRKQTIIMDNYLCAASCSKKAQFFSFSIILISMKSWSSEENAMHKSRNTGPRRERVSVGETIVELSWVRRVNLVLSENSKLTWVSMQKPYQSNLNRAKMCYSSSNWKTENGRNFHAACQNSRTCLNL